MKTIPRKNIGILAMVVWISEKTQSNNCQVIKATIRIHPT